MSDILKIVGRGGVAGFLFGLPFVTWINPGTTEGSLLLVLICVTLGTFAALVLNVFFGRKGKRGNTTKD